MAIQLVLGLGNPGVEYAFTRHNIGFDVAGEVVRRRGRAGWISRSDCELSVIAPGRMVVVARPQGFMNRSGEVAKGLLSDLDVPAEDMLVVVDDVDLPLGMMRIRTNGGPGTHNGLRSLCSEVGRDFSRLRLGVRGTDSISSLADYVLSPFDETEAEIVGAMVARAADAIDCAIRQGTPTAMNTFNRQPETLEA